MEASEEDCSMHAVQQARTASPRAPSSGGVEPVLLLPATSYPVVERVTVFWLYVFKWQVNSGPYALSPAFWASEPALQGMRVATSRPPPQHP